MVIVPLLGCPVIENVPPLVPASFAAAFPVTEEFTIVFVKSFAGIGDGKTLIVMVVLLHCCGFTAVLQTVYVTIVLPVKLGFGVKVYCPVVGLIVIVPVDADGWVACVDLTICINECDVTLCNRWLL